MSASDRHNQKGAKSDVTDAIVAYQAGSLHFNMRCTLVDITSGRQLVNHDCYRELPEEAPAWEKTLRDAQ